LQYLSRVLNGIKSNIEKEIAFIYFFSFFIYVFINNVFYQSITLIWWHHVSFRPLVFAEYCLNIRGETALKDYVSFFILKFIFIAFIYLLLKTQLPLRVKNLIFEICISYFLFDFLFLLLYPTSLIFHFDVLWYFGSSFQQFLGERIWKLPVYTSSVFWSILLIIYFYFARIFNYKEILIRIFLSFLSFCFFLAIIFFFFR